MRIDESLVATNEGAAWSNAKNERSRRTIPIDDDTMRTARSARGLCRDLGGVLTLSGLLGNAEHRTDLRPRTIGVASIADGVEQRGINIVPLLHEFRDSPKRFRPRLDEIRGVNVVGPFFERLGSLCSGRGHGVHQPFRNFERAGMA